MHFKARVLPLAPRLALPLALLPTPLLALLLLALLLAGCNVAVSKEAYQRDLDAMRQQQDWLEAQKKALHAESVDWQGKWKASQEQLQTCTRDKVGAQDELAATKKALDGCTNSRGNCAKDLADCQIASGKLEAELRRTRGERDAKAKELAELQERLAKVEAGIRSVRERLQKLVEAGKLRVKVANGFLVIEMASDILFDTGKAEVKPTAKPVLAELAAVLKDMTDKRFQIAGHTDDTGTDAFNWRLSTDRALAVLQELVTAGLSPQKLSAGGYGKYLPVVPNDSTENRTRNRRVELLLMPDLSEIFRLVQ